MIPRFHLLLHTGREFSGTEAGIIRKIRVGSVSLIAIS